MDGDIEERAVPDVDDIQRMSIRSAAAILDGIPQSDQTIRLLSRISSADTLASVAIFEDLDRLMLLIVFVSPTTIEPGNYLRSWTALANAVDEAFADWMFANQRGSVLITGYSSAAALAVLEAGRLRTHRQLDSDQLRVVTFDCPRIDAIWSDLVPSTIHIAIDPSHVQGGVHIPFGMIHVVADDHRPITAADYKSTIAAWNGELDFGNATGSTSDRKRPRLSNDDPPDQWIIKQCAILCSSNSETAPLSGPIALERLVKVRTGVQLACFRTDQAIIVVIGLDARYPLESISVDDLVPWNHSRSHRIPRHLQTLWDSIQDELLHRSLIDSITGDPSIPIIFTGFAHGACIAVLAAMAIVSRLSIADRLSLITIGCPAVWTKPVADAIQAEIPNLYRIVYGSDSLAAPLPNPTLQHIGRVLHFRETGDVHNELVWNTWHKPDETHSDIALYRESIIAWDGNIQTTDGLSKSSKTQRKRNRNLLLEQGPHRDLLVDMAEVSCLVYDDEPQIIAKVGQMRATRPFRLVAFLTSDEDCEVGVFWYGPETGHDRDLVIAFRGSSSVKDIYIDLATNPVPFEQVFGKDDAARVHQGFLMQFMSVKDRLENIVKEYQHLCDHIVVCGHSLGAANSILCSLYLEKRFNLGERLIQIGYGCSRIGNAEFRDAYKSRVQNSYLIINNNDLITGTLMMSAFAHVGRLLHIRPPFDHMFDAVPPGWSPYSVSDHSILNYIEQLRRWSGRIIPCPETELIIQSRSSSNDDRPFTPFEILCTFAD